MKKRITKKDEKDEFEKEYVAEILEDFRSRQIDRKAYETWWQMNINFYIGNQHCVIDGKGDVVDNLKQYLWEEREVYNHIAPIVELRLSKLSKVRPTLNVIPFSDNIDDVSCRYLVDIGSVVNIVSKSSILLNKLLK